MTPARRSVGRTLPSGAPRAGLVATAWSEHASTGREWEASELVIRVRGPSEEVGALLDEVKGGRCTLTGREGVPGLVLARASPRLLSERVQTPDGARTVPTEEELELRRLLDLLEEADRTAPPTCRPGGGRVRTPEGRPADARTRLLDDGRVLLEPVGTDGPLVLDPAACVELAHRLVACASGTDPDADPCDGDLDGEDDGGEARRRWRRGRSRTRCTRPRGSCWRPRTTPGGGRRCGPGSRGPCA